MFRRCACAALAVVLTLMAMPALAKDDDDDDSGDKASEEADETEVDFNRTGPYLSLAGVWGVEEFDNSNNISIDDSGGVNARVGYRALPWLSVEAVGEYMVNFNMDFGSDNGDLSMWNVGANLRLNLPTDLIQPYLIVGGGYLGADLKGACCGNGQDGHGGFARIGAGMEFYPWAHVGLDGGVGYVIPTGEVDDLRYLSITAGVIYRF